MIDAGTIPSVAYQGELTIGTVTLRTYVLIDGRHILDADDTAALFAAWEAGEPLSVDDADELSRFLQGKGEAV